MTEFASSSTSEAFFLDTGHGKRFCMFHAPREKQTCDVAVLYIHPFGEEMNMSRRMAARMSRAYAEAGLAVLQLDLLGCGDSEGQLKDANWSAWVQDLDFGVRWLHQNVCDRIVLWGLRLGATLALDFAQRSSFPVMHHVLWQPVMDGRKYLNQFLRLGLAAEVIGMTGAGGGTQSLRNRIENGEMIEIGGYELSPVLVASIDALDIASLRVDAASVDWFDIIPEGATSLPPGRRNSVQSWIDGNRDARLHTIPGPSFWSTVEVTECERLISETRAILIKEPA